MGEGRGTMVNYYKATEKFLYNYNSLSKCKKRNIIYNDNRISNVEASGNRCFYNFSTIVGLSFFLVENNKMKGGAFL
jgi:hypothetical protein